MNKKDTPPVMTIHRYHPAFTRNGYQSAALAYQSAADELLAAVDELNRASDEHDKGEHQAAVDRADQARNHANNAAEHSAFAGQHLHAAEMKTRYSEMETRLSRLSPGVRVVYGEKRRYSDPATQTEIEEWAAAVERGDPEYDLPADHPIHQKRRCLPSQPES